MTKPAILLAALLIVVEARTTLAQDQNPPPDFVIPNADGTTTIDSARLIPGEQVTLPPPDGVPYLQHKVPGTDFEMCYGCMTFQTYTTGDGYTIYAPDTYTATVMSVTGQSPFNAEPDYAVLSNQMAVAGLFGALGNMGISPGDIWTAAGDQAKTQWNQSPGGGGQLTLVNDPFALIKLNVANLMNGSINRAALASLATGDISGAVSTSLWMNGMFVFKGGPAFIADCVANCLSKNPVDKGEKDDLLAIKKPVPTVAPTRLPTAIPTPMVTVLTVDCPLNPSISQSDPASTVQAVKVAPNFPVVVGQDPDRTGVTLSVTMAVPPLHYSYSVKHQHSRCEGSGCGQPAGFGPVNIINWETCDRVTETHVDRLASIVVSANLAQSSIDWIHGDLAARYPDAHVYQSNWALFPGLPGTGGIGAGGESFSMVWTRLQIRDPGSYIVNVNGVTTGTPRSAPRAFSFSQETFAVDLVMVALTK